MKVTVFRSLTNQVPDTVTINLTIEESKKLWRALAFQAGTVRNTIPEREFYRDLSYDLWDELDQNGYVLFDRDIPDCDDL